MAHSLTELRRASGRRTSGGRGGAVRILDLALDTAAEFSVGGRELIEEFSDKLGGLAVETSNRNSEMEQATSFGDGRRAGEIYLRHLRTLTPMGTADCEEYGGCESPVTG